MAWAQRPVVSPLRAPSFIGHSHTPKPDENRYDCRWCTVSGSSVLHDVAFHRFSPPYQQGRRLALARQLRINVLKNPDRNHWQLTPKPLQFSEDFSSVLLWGFASAFCFERQIFHFDLAIELRKLQKVEKMTDHSVPRTNSLVYPLGIRPKFLRPPSADILKEFRHLPGCCQFIRAVTPSVSHHVATICRPISPMHFPWNMRNLLLQSDGWSAWWICW